MKVNLSDYLSNKLNHSYTYLANLFSEVKGTTIEQFYLAHKIEKVKELLVYDELSLTEIAWKMHYSSVAHLSNQFKKMTGLTPTHFKKLKHKRRQALGKV
jgi:AraC-like DNA-binding protein